MNILRKIDIYSILHVLAASPRCQSVYKGSVEEQDPGPASPGLLDGNTSVGMITKKCEIEVF